jgi:hypothetical protein
MQFNNHSNIEMTEFKKQIHCKLTYKDQIRRFLFCGTEFAELRGHVCNLLSLNDGFVLKYVDNESDLITLTSTDDLNLALELSPKLLRLVVDPTTAPPSSSLPPSLDLSSLPLPFPHGPPSSPPPPSFYSPLSGGCTPSTGSTYFPHQEYRHSRGDKCIQRIQGKIDYFKGLLAQTPPEDSRRPDLLNQIQRLEGRLARVNQWKEKGGFKHRGGGCHKKWKEEKKKRKEKNKQQLTPEAFEQVQLIKAQIGSLKPVLYQLKVTKKAKKSELDNALKIGQGDKESLWNEILKLKEAIVDNKKQIAALKDQIHAIHEAAKLSPQ